MSKQKLHDMAIEAQKLAHAPYSKCQIGAAILLDNGKMYSGSNIENASFGATVCAERVAIWKARSENAGASVVEVLVLSDESSPWPPCGLCRQVLAEFAANNCVIHLANKDKITGTLSFKDIFPHAFLPTHLQK